jgi:cytochrome c5
MVSTPAVESQPDAETRKSWGGAEIYDEVCDKCHKMGVDGAPELGDVEAWRPRVQQGQEVLFDHVLDGFKKMPARGECEFCSDEQLRAAMEFMISRSRD